MSAATYIIDFAAAAAAGPALAGGKGAQLGRLARYGLPVPDGFVVTTAALAQAPGGELVTAAGGDEAALTAVRQAIRDTPLPPTLAAALHEAIRRRGWEQTPLAVRSSAPMEDSGRASSAGIHHSALNVVGVDAAAAALRAVWASLWTPQAVAYRRRLGIDEAAMAVVVMPMLPAVAAGVAFSCDPRSGRDDRIVVNAVHGLGEPLVAGQLGGEEIVLQEDPVTEAFTVVRRHGGTQAFRAVPAAGGGTRHEPGAQAGAVLDDGQALTLAGLVRDAAFALDYAAPWFDIEWVWDGERFHLVQARPVTARPWHTYPALAGQAAIWSNGNTRDVVPHVMDAADWAYARTMVNLLLEQGWALMGYPLRPGAQRAALFQGRLYLNASFIQWEGYDALGIEPAAMNRLLGGHHPEIPVPPPRLAERAARLRRMLRYLVRSGGRRRAGKREAAAAHALCAGWRNEDLGRLDNRELAGRIAELNAHVRRQTGLMFLQGSGGGALAALLDLVERHLPGESHAIVAALMAGGEPSVTARQGYELLALAASAAADPAIAAVLRAGHSSDWRQLPDGSTFRRELAGFIENYGHRCIYESYLRSPRWREDASYLLRQLADLMDCDPEETRARQQEANTRARERLSRRLPLWARGLARHLVKAANGECNDRELARSAFVAYGEASRRLLLEAGARLTAGGGLETAGHIFHLTPTEVAAALAGRLAGPALAQRVADRRRRCAEWEAAPVSEVILGDSAAPPSPVAPAHGDEWRGTPVGAGVAGGPARIIRHPREGARLAPGDILVAPSTDPAWTPLFLKAGGLVMETGGYLSHGAIVAREFGIPAVINLPGILEALADGEPLEVDGWRGTVRRISD